MPNPLKVCEPGPRVVVIVEPRWTAVPEGKTSKLHSHNLKFAISPATYVPDVVNVTALKLGLPEETLNPKPYIGTCVVPALTFAAPTWVPVPFPSGRCE